MGLVVEHQLPAAMHSGQQAGAHVQNRPRKNAGMSRSAGCMQGDAVEDFTQISRERLEKTFMVNIVGMISLAQKAVPHMKPGSAIINVR